MAKTDFVKTTSPTVSNSLAGVRSQLRYHNAGLGAGTGTSGQNPTTSRTENNRHALNATTNLARLQRRASEIQVASQQADINTQAAAAEDTQGVRQQSIDQSQPDTLDQLARGAAGLIAVGQATTKLTRKVGLDGVATFLEKIPLIGKSKELRKLDALYEQALDDSEAQNHNLMNQSLETAKLYGDMIGFYNGLRGSLVDIFTPEQMEMLVPDAEVRRGMNVATNNYISALESSGVFVTGDDNNITQYDGTGPITGGQ